MELTARRAVELSIDLWTWLGKTGKEKEDWPEWEWNGGQYPKVGSDCFLCEHDSAEKNSCEACPYYIKYTRCTNAGTPFAKWCNAEDEGESKKFAKQFLNQLKKILKEL